MFTSTWSLMAQCGLLVCLATAIAQPDPHQTDSCHEISKVLSEKFQKHTTPQHVDNLYTCKRGITCCNTISEFFFQHNVEQQFTQFALYTVRERLKEFTGTVYASQVNWDMFSSIIAQYESGLPITYEHFFEIALTSVISLKEECLRRKEIRALKRDTIEDIKSLVNNIYSYLKGVQAINATLLATANLKPSKHCSTNLSRAGVPIDAKFKPSGCPLCLDSTASIMVCRDLCLNVVRGCYASILKYHHLYMELIKKMDEIYFVLNYNLEMQNGSFYTFIAKLEKHVKKPDFVNQCTSPYRKRSSRGEGLWRRRRKRFSDEPDLSHFKAFFSKQMGLETAIVDPGTLPCAVSNNTPPCWNGQEIGNYKHMSYSYTLKEQEINPEGADLDLNEDQEFAVQMMKHALLLAKNTTAGEDLFGYEKEKTEITTQTPLNVDPDTDENYIHHSVTDHSEKTENHVENYETTPTYTISEVQVNSNHEKSTDTNNNNCLRVRLNYCLVVLLVGILIDMR